MSGPLLRVEGLRAGYGELPVLRDVALEVYEAEIVALVGSNGAGKTTLLRALSGVLPWRGRVTFEGASLHREQLRMRYLAADSSIFLRDGSCSIE
jgi:branched-chain amino acid transport system ATP-binding protein